jgi:hypothetical protein
VALVGLAMLTTFLASTHKTTVLGLETRFR